MENIRQDIELLRRKATECQQVARRATDENFRLLNANRAKIYLELIEEAERNLQRNRILDFRRAS